MDSILLHFVFEHLFHDLDFAFKHSRTMKLLRGSIGHFANLETVWPHWFLVFEIFCYSKISFHLYLFVIPKYEQYKSGTVMDAGPEWAGSGQVLGQSWKQRFGGKCERKEKKGWHNDFRQAKRKAEVIIYEMEHGTGLKGKVIVQLWCLGFHCLLDTQAEVLTGKSAELKSIIHV